MERELQVTAAQAAAKQAELSEADRLARGRDALRLAAEEESAFRREASRRETEFTVARLQAEADLVDCRLVPARVVHL